MLADAGFKVVEHRTLAEIHALLAGSKAQPSLDAWARQPQKVEG
jgi:hypothetical protein